MPNEAILILQLFYLELVLKGAAVEATCVLGMLCNFQLV